MTVPARRGESLNIWRSLRGLPRDVWILALASLINRAGTMVLPFLVLYLTKELGMSAPRAGLGLAVYGAGAILAAPLAGALSDSVGPLPIMRWSLLLTGALLLAFPYVRSFTGVIIITFAWAITTEAFRPANLALIADIVVPEQRKPAYALSRLAINLGMSIGPAAAGFIAARSFRSIFVVDAITTIAAAIVLFAAPLASVKHVVPEADAPRRSRLSSLLVTDDPRLLVFLVALFLTGIVFFQHEGALPLFLVDYLALSPAFYGMLFTINTLMIVFMEVPLNMATSHWPHHRALALGAFLFAVGSGAFAVAGGPAVIIAGIVIWTVGEMMLFPQAAAYVAEIAPPHRRGEYMGSYSLAFSIAFAFAPWAGTTGLTVFGPLTLWIAVFIVGIVSGLIMLRVSAGSRAYLSPG
jgi:MFS family permease